VGRKIQNITIVVEHTGKRIPVEELDEDITVGELLKTIAYKTNLPAGTSEILVRLSTHKQLLTHQTFKTIGIENDEVLLADFERVAGGNISFYENGRPKEIEFTPEETNSVIEILRESQAIQNGYAASPLRDVGVFARIFLKLRGVLQGFGEHQDTDTADAQKLLQDQVLSSLHRQLITHRKNLNRLEEQLAKYGQMDTPLYLLNRIDGEKAENQHLEKQLNEESGGFDGR
jgi:hypothetical protein